jgi:hypothetical protein
MVTDSGSPSSNSVPRLRLALHASDRRLWVAIAVVVSLIVYLSTLQVDVNGSVHAFATDVGEIQNALPRWGLIHRSGYPLYTAVGSLLVAALRVIGIEPAAGASIYSMLWGVVSVGLLVVLAQELGVPGPAAALGALAAALSTSMWVFSSVAEVHTLTSVFSLATLIFALQFGRTGGRRQLLLLALVFSQGVMHQRSLVVLAPAVLVLVWPQLGALWRGLGAAIGLSLLAPLTYLYMPFRVWTGATWVFGSPGTWEGFWEMMFDNRAERVFTTYGNLEEWRERAEITLGILADDMLWPQLVIGLAALILLARKKGGWREGLSMSLAWIPFLLLTLIIWRGRVVDAQLAAKLPITALAGVGLALALDRLGRRWRWLGIAAGIALVLALVGWGWRVRPFVLSITRDPSAREVIEVVSQVAPPPDDRPTTLVSTWGLDYWALAYAQECRGQLPGLNLVDHNANLRAISDRGERLLILDKILHVFPVWRWEERLGRLYLASAAPHVIEISRTPPVDPTDLPVEGTMDMGNGLRLRSAELEWTARDRLLLTIHWEAAREVAVDHSVAVHLVSHEPPRSGDDILAQADKTHPVDGWYPTSRWSQGEIVRDRHSIEVPEGSAPIAVRIALYRTDPVAGFINSPWLSLALPER